MRLRTFDTLVLSRAWLCHFEQMSAGEPSQFSRERPAPPLESCRLRLNAARLVLLA